MVEQFTFTDINGEATMSRAAFEEYQNNIKHRRDELGRYELGKAAWLISGGSKAEAMSLLDKLINAVDAEEGKASRLTVYNRGSNQTYKRPKHPTHAHPETYWEAYWYDLNEWIERNEQRINFKFPNPDTTPAGKVEAVPVVTPAQVTQNKLRTNILDPAIDKAIKQAKGSLKLAPVYLELRELALAGEKPFTGAFEGDAMCYTNGDNLPDKLTKNALGKKLERRAKPSQ